MTKVVIFLRNIFQVYVDRCSLPVHLEGLAGDVQDLVVELQADKPELPRDLVVVRPLDERLRPNPGVPTIADDLTLGTVLRRFVYLSVR